MLRYSYSLPLPLMKRFKYLVGVATILLACFSFSQAQIIQKPIAKDDTAAMKRIRILNADSLVFRKTGGEAIQKLIGKVKMKQDSTLFLCDSAYFYENKNLIEAFSEVRVKMSDSVSLYADELKYDGETRIAEVYDNILLTDLVSELRTDRMTYYRKEKYGKFVEGGSLKDKESVLTSDRGYYYPDLDKAYFKGNVKLDHPDYLLETDTMGYDTDSKIANFLTYTLITSEDGIIETTQGSYDTENKKIDLLERSSLQDSSYTLTANTIRYTDDDNMGIATGDVLVTQEDSSLEIRGQFGIFNRKTDESTLTQDPVAIQFMDEDTLYIFADTLRAVKQQLIRPILEIAPDTSVKIKVDSLSPPSVKDSASMNSAADNDTLSQDSLPSPAPIQKGADTTDRRVFLGNYDVYFFMNDMQGRCDSMIYLYDDSIIYLYQDPVLWSEQGQITGDTIKIWMKNNEVDSMWVGPNGFLVSQADNIGFDQIKGKEFRVKFRNNELAYLHVIGNAESIYYIAEEDSAGRSSYEGMNQALSQEMTLYFSNNDLDKILFKAKPSGTYSPIHEVIFKENILAGMKWRIEEKPQKPKLLAIDIKREASEDEMEEIDLFELDTDGSEDEDEENLQKEK